MTENKENPLWLNNELQFARLICEIVANEELPNWTAIRDSMDLEDEELQGLFDRANNFWERWKEKNNG